MTHLFGSTSCPYPQRRLCPRSCKARICFPPTKLLLRTYNSRLNNVVCMLISEKPLQQCSFLHANISYHCAEKSRNENSSLSPRKKRRLLGIVKQVSWLQRRMLRGKQNRFFFLHCGTNWFSSAVSSGTYKDIELSSVWMCGSCPQNLWKYPNSLDYI